jgi:hypothetical protein
LQALRSRGINRKPETGAASLSDAFKVVIENIFQ